LDAVIGIVHGFPREDCTAGRLHHIAPNFRIGFFECRCASRERSTRSDEVAEGVDGVVRLGKDLRTCMQVVRAKATGVVELVGTEGIPCVRDFLGHALNLLEIAAGDLPRLRFGQLVHQDKLCA